MHLETIKPTRSLDTRIEALESQGFTVNPDSNPGYLRISCTQCEALAINGIATHERSCPNARHECAGCNAMIPARQKYCADCHTSAL